MGLWVSEGLRGQHAQGQVRSSFRMRTRQRYIRGSHTPNGEEAEGQSPMGLGGLGGGGG